MEPTNTRLDRILKSLQQALTVCDTEIGDITSQILVREEALNLLEADTRSLSEQFEKFEETLAALKQKNDTVEARVKSSQSEIDTLHSKINNLKPSASDPEVQTMIDHHTAAILHHEDVLTVAKTELLNDRQQQEEIKRAMENLMTELNKKPTSRIDQNKTSEEIQQLKSTLTELDQTRDQIVGLINTLDPNRIEGSGESLILHESEQTKRKLDDHFVRTPQSGGGRPTKRMRPDSYKTPKKRTIVDAQMSDESATEPEIIHTTGPAMFVPFLPTTAAKLLSVVDGRFDAVEWYAQTAKIPMNEDISNAIGSWTTMLQTKSRHFLLQKYKTVFTESYRIVAIDPYAVVHDPETYCVPLASSRSFPQTKLLLDQMGSLEELDTFNYEGVWRLLSKDS